MVQIETDIFGLAINPFNNEAQVVRRYTMSNSNNVAVAVLQLGATIQSIKTPDAHHQVEDICLGFDDVAGYTAQRDHLFGCVLGRVAERVANGEFIMEERRHIVSKNLKDKHQMHGGFIGFDRIIWDLDSLRPDGVTLKHVSPHLHEGYQGNLTVLIHYTLDDDNRFFMRIEATTDRTTAVNIANHTYFNLAGHNGGKEGLNTHRIMINAEHFIELNEELLPTGKFMRVENTIYDLRLPVFVGDRLRQFETHVVPGYDVCFAMDKDFDENIVRFVGRLRHPDSGRFVEIYTNQPGLQFTTANTFPDESRNEVPIMGKQCTRYWRHGAFSLQLQKFPDSPNNLDFPTVYMLPSEKYYHETMFHFGVQESWKCCADPDEINALNSLV